MNEKIYTIPVMEALNEPGECPFCEMYTKLERLAIEFTMGPSYMETDIRTATNEIGFCKKHYGIMFLEKNALGLSLMVHTHLQQINKDLAKILKDPSALAAKKKIFSKAPEGEGKLDEYISKIDNSCFVCNKIETTLERYLDTFFYLYETETSEIDGLIKNGKGFCLPHFKTVMRIAPNKLSAKSLPKFNETVIKKQQEELQALSDDLDWFTQKFDYRFADAPWKNSKDALPRAIQKISSHITK